MSFEQVTTRLLSGDFVCESTAPEAFRWLNRQAARDDVSAYLDRIGRRLAETPNGYAFYATWKRTGIAERQDIKHTFAGIKQIIRPVITFLTLCMEAGKKDSAPVPGDRLEYPALLKAVTESAHLLEMLREFAVMGKEFTVSDSSPKGMLDKVIQQMQRFGYLAELNREQESYRFTGKLDYYFQVIDFLGENEEGVTDTSHDQSEASEQGKMF